MKQLVLKWLHTHLREQIVISKDLVCKSVKNIRQSKKIPRHLEMPKIDKMRSCLRKGIMTYLRGSRFWRAVKTGLVSIGRYFAAEMYIILGVGTWPNTQVCQNYLWGQLLMLSLFGISRHLLIFWLCLIMSTDLADYNLFSEVCE